MRFEVLSKKHTEQLLAFEQHNRQWFESLISPRADTFYSVAGVSEHIHSLTQAMAYGQGFSGVILKDDTIVARGNLTDISHQTASVGYRVAQNHTGQGIASFCLSQLISVAKTKLALNSLEAKVLDNNAVSAHVLLKQGFTKRGYSENFMTLNKQEFGCSHFKLEFTK
ncbi:GNAT family N-acetyltransferase [Psychrobium sp. 1_MG-2023]|uniref:GNAT family N-acetyltransferase n=1 Tax=Psychrobium sp. 1_MG-2023 TaxID=3062624 RepID=UPI000C323101|nr:GNAT family N-acetyltransferase [Psychrobium sp. 1_MG-2023]MDP2562601.1 GNAT family N-acetyltransferase [Psychrobium sp. 1_MG-2023]PKF59635.1 N-acetyltransferase [Alteromonadales bacterium alter-6D02]